EEVAQRHTRGGYGGEGGTEDDWEGAFVRGPEVEQLVALTLDDLYHDEWNGVGVEVEL
ncbi:hypothetical protein F441_18899, partial [Phytophthora nicotianae CJ01A1]